MASHGRAAIKAIIDFIEFSVIGLAILFFVYIFAGQPLRVTGDSMLPNYFDGEQIIAEKISVKTGNLDRGEIIIFKHPEQQNKLLIKRVIALPGEVVTISNDKVYVNQEPLEENYLTRGIRTLGGKRIQEDVDYEVPPNSYVFMGDNRESSTDSREWGAINKEMVVGKAFLVYYPFNNVKLIR
jgi:signal peptidase I